MAQEIDTTAIYKAIKKQNGEGVANYEVMLDLVRVLIDNEPDSQKLVRVLNEELSGYQTKIRKDRETGETIISIKDGNKTEKELARTQNGYLTGLNLYKTTVLREGFLEYNKTLKTLTAPKLKTMEDGCFCDNKTLRELNIPELEEMGFGCFCHNTNLTQLNAPKLRTMGNNCFHDNKTLRELNIPELEEMWSCCFYHNTNLTQLNAPELRIMGSNCFYHNTNLTQLNAPELRIIEDSCFYNNKTLRELNIPKLLLDKGIGITWPAKATHTSAFLHAATMLAKPLTK